MKYGNIKEDNTIQVGQLYLYQHWIIICVIKCAKVYVFWTGEDFMSEYICDDRNVLENAQEIRNMSDEEFKEYISEIKENQS